MSLKASVAYLIEKKKVIHGKKAFQKYMYFLDAVGVPTPLVFRMYHYGPYSSKLDYESDYLELVGAIKIEKNNDRYGYVIKAGHRVKEILDEEKQFIKIYKDKMDKIIDSLPDDPRQLELWSTTHFVARTLQKYYDVFSKSKVAMEVKKIKKDKFTEQEIKHAYEQLVQKSLISTN